MTRLKLQKEIQVAVSTLLKTPKLNKMDDFNEQLQRNSASFALLQVGKPALTPILTALGKDWKGGARFSDEFHRNGDARLAAVRIVRSMGPQANTPTARRVLLGLVQRDPVPLVKSEARLALRDIQMRR